MAERGPFPFQHPYLLFYSHLAVQYYFLKCRRNRKNNSEKYGRWTRIIEFLPNSLLKKGTKIMACTMYTCAIITKIFFVTSNITLLFSLTNNWFLNYIRVKQCSESRNVILRSGRAAEMWWRHHRTKVNVNSSLYT